jgi:hypothetical protein
VLWAPDRQVIELAAVNAAQGYFLEKIGAAMPPTIRTGERSRRHRKASMSASGSAG